MSISLDVYQGQKKYVHNIVTTPIPSEKRRKENMKPLDIYNERKFGVDIIDQMARKYSVKASSR